MKCPFLGGTYVARSRNLAYSRAVNIYPEIVEGKEGKEVGAFYGCPGLVSLVTLGNGPIRGGARLGDFLYVVSGPGIYKVTNTFGSTLLGNLTTSAGPVSVETNNTQVLFSDGATGVMWDTIAAALTTVASFPAGARMLAYQDGFCLASIQGSNQVFQSDLNNMGNWNPLNFSSADSQPGEVMMIKSHNREVWIFCKDNTEVWINAGLPGFAFQRIQGVYIEVGCEASFSVVTPINGSLMWLSRDENGDGIVYSTQGYMPKRVSTYSIEREWKTYTTMESALAMSYQQEGHTFYVLTFPAGDATWVYDVSTGYWHERAALDSAGQLHRHWMNFHSYFAELNVIGDYRNGTLYKMHLDLQTDNGTPRPWVRSWRAFPSGQQPYEDVEFNALQIDMQKGILVPDGADPHLTLRWSNDGGHNWSYDMIHKVGRVGETAGTVRFRRLGSTSQSKGRDRVFELSSSDAYPVALIAADMDAAKA